MITVEQANELARDPLSRLVAHHKKRFGSLMPAYSKVGTDLGKSGSWVRKVIGRQPDITVSFADWLNIDTLCAKLDAVSERLEARAASIRGDNDETSPVPGAVRAGTVVGDDGSAKAVTP